VTEERLDQLRADVLHLDAAIPIVAPSCRVIASDASTVRLVKK
jgi:hypothetical protein